MLNTEVRPRCWVLMSTVLGLLAGCQQRTDLAPVSEAWYHRSQSNQHVVRRQETLYAIAWRYQLDYRHLAAHNTLPPPYALSVGQILKIPSESSKQPVKKLAVTPPIIKKPTTTKHSWSPPVTGQRLTWRWPLAKPQITKPYVAKRYPGIEMTSAPNTRVVAAASGRVVYSGRGLRGFGDLILVKHNDDVLSAYAHNKRLLVKEGQSVMAGQAIAVMGLRPIHFQIRRKGKPVNPSQYLPTRSSTNKR